jgi:uncharacterized protein (DUF1697 family)
MQRHVAFLRGVMPTNAKMSELRACFEGAGFTNVRTVLSSGNVVFDARQRSESAIVREAMGAMARTLDRTFHPFVRSQAALRDLIARDPSGPNQSLRRQSASSHSSTRHSRQSSRSHSSRTAHESSPSTGGKSSPSTCRIHAVPCS